MEFSSFVKELLHIGDDFRIAKIERHTDSDDSFIRIYLEHHSDYCQVDGIQYKIYDYAPERTWQHLCWFEYPCFIVCRIPRYIDIEGKVKLLEVSFAEKGKSYTRLFSSHIIDALQTVKVQNSVATLFHTSPYIVRSIMEAAVSRAIEARGDVTDLVTVSLDEKAFSGGHNYATILVDSKKDYVVDMTEGRAEKDVKTLLYCTTSEEKLPQLERVNIDMWKPYINVIEEVAPQAIIVHDKFHTVKKLSEAIDKTGRKEVKTEPLLKKNRYTVLKNQSNRTEQQQLIFEELDNANLKTAQAWHIRENFKSIFDILDASLATKLLEEWMRKSIEKGLNFVNDVIKTIQNHKQGVINAITTRTNSGRHENINGRIQAVIAKARGFYNFDRFRINVLFYFGKLNFH
jgi:transposase